MTWQGAAVRELRQRLGWSRAEMARRLGVTLEGLTNWEEKDLCPNEECLNQLDFMQRHVDTHSDQISRKPVADALMSQLGLTQIHTEEIEDTIQAQPDLFIVAPEK